MIADPDPIALSLRRTNALLAWWGLPGAAGAGAGGGELQRFRNFAADVQTLYGDAAGRQASALLATNDEIVEALRQLLQQRRSRDLLAAESRLVVSVLEAAAMHARTWIEVGSRVNARWNAFATQAIAGEEGAATAAADRAGPVDRGGTGA